jgi:hypothetical protein
MCCIYVNTYYIYIIKQKQKQFLTLNITTHEKVKHHPITQSRNTKRH